MDKKKLVSLASISGIKCGPPSYKVEEKSLKTISSYDTKDPNF
jgi:hypothetical protein